MLRLSGAVVRINNVDEGKLLRTFQRLALKDMQNRSHPLSGYFIGEA
jgi:hypothetical protein